MHPKKTPTVTLVILAAIITTILTYAANILGTKFADAAVEKVQRKNAEIAKQIKSSLEEVQTSTEQTVPPPPPGAWRMQPFDPISNPGGRLPDLNEYHLKENSDVENILGIKRYLCVSKEDSVEEPTVVEPANNVSGYVENTGILPAPPPEPPANIDDVAIEEPEPEHEPTQAELKAEEAELKAKEAEMIRQDRKCVEDFDAVPLDMFAVSRSAEPSDHEQEIKAEMNKLADKYKRKYTYICVSVINLTQGPDHLVGISIPSFADDPAPIGSLISPEVSSSVGCREGYTAQDDMLINMIPAGYHYDVSWQLPLGSKEPEALKQTPRPGPPKDLVRVDVHVCTKRADAAMVSNPSTSDDSEWENEYMACAYGFEDQPVAMFSLSRLIPAISEQEAKLTGIMSEIKKQKSDSETYTCISAKTQNDTTWDVPKHASIPGLSDKPAPKDNLQLKTLKSGNRCPEGYTEHQGVLVDLIPANYHLFNNTDYSKDHPPYQFIY